MHLGRSAQHCSALMTDHDVPATDIIGTFLHEKLKTDGNTRSTMSDLEFANVKPIANSSKEFTCKTYMATVLKSWAVTHLKGHGIEPSIIKSWVVAKDHMRDRNAAGLGAQHLTAAYEEFQKEHPEMNDEPCDCDEQHGEKASDDDKNDCEEKESEDFVCSEILVCYNPNTYVFCMFANMTKQICFLHFQNHDETHVFSAFSET